MGYVPAMDNASQINAPVPVRTFSDHVRLTLALAWPVVLSRSGLMIMVSTDVAMTGHAGQIELAHLSIAMANSGHLQIEIIQQRNDAPSMYMEFLTQYGEGLQHIAYWSTDYQNDYEAILASGLKVGQEGQINGPEGRFVYFDSQLHPGTVIELSDISGGKGRFFNHIREASLEWDGSRPVRPIN